MSRSKLPRERGNRSVIYVETARQSGGVERLAITPQALSSPPTFDPPIKAPPKEIIECLMAEGEAILDRLCEDSETALLRDKLFVLLEILAYAEAAIRVVPPGSHKVVGNHTPVSALRPEHPLNLERGVRRRLGLQPTRLRSVPWILATIGQLTTRRRAHSGHSAKNNGVPHALLITGNKSFERAVSPVRADLANMKLRTATYDESLNTSSNYPGVLSTVSLSRVLTESAKPRMTSLNYLENVWKTELWWGNAWFPEARSALSGIARYYLAVAHIYKEAFERIIGDSRVVLTPQAASVQLRALLMAARTVHVPVIVIPHGLYIDSPIWKDLSPACFTVSGDHFARVLRARGFKGRIEVVGATFFSDNTVPKTDIAVALRPIEKAPLSSHESLVTLIRSVVGAAEHLNPIPSIGLRPHPRQRVDEIEALLARYAPRLEGRLEIDHDLKGKILVGPESSIIAQARSEGVPVVLTLEPGINSAYDFESMPGVFLARASTEIEAALHFAMTYADDDEARGRWRQMLIQPSGSDATSRVVQIVREYVDSTSRGIGH